MNSRARTFVLVGTVVIAVLGLVATVRIGLAGYRQGLTEARMSEIAMAVLLELHYSKDAILESYLNEVYLGQEGPRAIHGFALAARHYFQAPLVVYRRVTAESVHF